MYWQSRSQEPLPQGALLCGVNFEGRFCRFEGDLPVGGQMEWEKAGGSDREEWIASLEGVDQEKLVLSRYEDYRLVSGLFDPMELVTQLTPNCYQWIVPIGGGALFLGASPERLFKLSKGTLWTEAVAGTRPAGEEQGRELLASEKDRWEQGLVTKGIVEALSPFAEDIEVGELSLLQRTRWQHLYTPIEARGVKGSCPELLQALHPTPAVGGYPRVGAQQKIRKLEGYDREFYAGAIGWMREDEGEFCVAIRSARWDGSHLRIYAGAGIVEGSDPASEWDETELKLSQWKQLLQIKTAKQPALSSMS